MYSVIRRIAARQREVWHSARAALFLRLIQPERGARTLDLGGSDGEFMARVTESADCDVTIADIDPIGLARARERGFRTAMLTEGDTLPFDDGAFDIVLCNSVIEHVTVPKSVCVEKRFDNREWIETSLSNQRRFAREIGRVGRRYFVQTPHRAFPIEAHTWLPFVGWLPHQTLVNVVRVTDRVWVKRCGYVDWNLLDEPVMASLFPDARLHVERVLGMPKSIIAYTSS